MLSHTHILVKKASSGLDLVVDVVVKYFTLTPL